ncbi:MAG: hypothetical protein COY80_04315 [Candidatus Pacebacteria bacterium CG_4_10_14_0_8_um_filter_42_14]|nr:MAG: hypothetical protein COY80_04315 [Candidatus Pacebacteria bacterium CG_4_10_14_0_8_um_filter_42_14]
MNKVLFLLVSFLCAIMFFAKFFFLVSENSSDFYLLAVIELISIVVLFGWSIFSFITSEKVKKMRPSRTRFSLPVIILATLCITLLVSSFIQTSVTNSLDWDAVALYDARAKFLLDGVKFSEMKSLTSFDFKNGYYYSLYPPFTSILHFGWYRFGIPAPVPVLYSLFLVMFATGIFLMLHPRLGISWSLLATFIVIGQQNLFSTSIIAYSNLPYTLYLSLGILFLHRYLIDKKNWYLGFGIILVMSSQWIRFLEPSWLIVVISFAAISWKSLSLRRTIIPAILLTASCIISYVSWKYFAEVVSQKETIFQTSLLNFLEPVLGIFTGSLLIISIAYLKMWGGTLIIYIGSIIAALNLQDEEAKADLFLVFLIVLSFSMYFFGLYFISFQFEWWPEMGGSLLRSSTFLLPVAVYLLTKATKQIFKNKTKI